MTTFSKTISIRWADIDPNFHLRHSVYYDFGSQFRIEVLEKSGLTLKLMQEEGFGPVLFREECIFKREIRLSDNITINAKISKMRPDASRWTIIHEFLSPENKLCALITVEGAWLDTKLRKLASPTPQIVIDVFNVFPKSDDFVLI
jgi:acyl-CoA thioester hydrolase